MTRFKSLMVVTLAALLAFSSVPARAQEHPQERKALTVDAIYGPLMGRLFKDYPSGLRWLPKSDRFSFIKRNGKNGTAVLVVENARNGKQKTILSSKELTYITDAKDTLRIPLSSYRWLPDESGLLFTFEGDIWLYSLKQKHLRRLTRTEAPEEEIQIAPNSRLISFVRNNDLYVLNLQSGLETRLTTDGSETILNGKLDWVYQEELVGRGIFRGHWWSPDSRHIAYLQFDESNVPQYPLVDWMPYHPTVEMMHYPKAGDPNPVVKLGVVSVESPKTIWMDTGDNPDVYIPRVYWLPNSKQVAFMRLDRLQQHLEFFFADISTGNARKVLEEKDPYFINVGDFVYFFKKKNQFIWGSETTGYRHLYIYDYQGKLVKQLTHGEWLVDAFLGVDRSEKWVYFTATEKSIVERHLYRVKTNGSGFKRLSRQEGTHSIRLSPSGSYYIDNYSNLLTPYLLTVHKTNGKKLRELARCRVDLAKEFNIRLPEIFTFKGETTGLTYYASMIKPPHFNPRKKYPVLIYVYGGPHAQVIRNAFGYTRYLWHLMMAQKGFIVFSMDNRGSWGRGHDWEKQVYRQLGKLELMDQLEGVAYLKKQPYVDANRIGIWGWSYGGYMTLYALTHADVFRTGVSVAPVTDWRDYDTIYTERYMGLPQENEEGYRNSSPVFFADSLKGMLYLIHGTGDDNVHFQNSVQMADALIDAGKMFHFMMYPQQKHGIAARADRIHLFKLITHFLEEHLKGEEKSEAAEHPHHQKM